MQGGYTWLAILAVVMSSVSAFYYLRVVWHMYFKEAPEGAVAGVAESEAESGAESGPSVSAETGDGVEPRTSEVGVVAAVSLAAAAVLVLGVFPEWLLSSAEDAVRLILGG